MATIQQASAAPELSCAGPLECCTKGFVEQLLYQGYAPATIHAKCDLLIERNRWLVRHQLPLAVLDEHRLRQFQASRRRQGKKRRGNPATAQQLLQYLREHGHAAPAAQAIDARPAALIVRDFEAFLRSERGLSTATVVSYLPVVRRFLHERFGRRALRLQQLRAPDLHRFVVREIQRVSRTHGKNVITALRSFLRFLQLRGAVPTDLARTLPDVATWRLSHLPGSLLPEQVERLLACCDRGSPSGKRDYAILLLLARLVWSANKPERSRIHTRSSSVTSSIRLCQVNTHGVTRLAPIARAPVHQPPDDGRIELSKLPTPLAEGRARQALARCAHVLGCSGYPTPSESSEGVPRTLESTNLGIPAGSFQSRVRRSHSPSDSPPGIAVLLFPAP